MLDGSRYFAEFPDEYPNRVPLSAAVLNALKALEREISRFVETAPEITSDSVRCDNEEC
jgi:hypothetical protein